MELPTAILSRVTLKMEALLTKEYKLLKGARPDIRLLREELQTIQQHFLSEADHPSTEADACLWRQARELFYDIEDSLDEFELRMGLEPGLTARGSKKLLANMRTRRGMAKEIYDLKRRVKEMRDLHGSRYKADNTPGITSRRTVGPRPSSLHEADASSLVGLDGPRDELAKLLIEKEPESATRLKVVSIVGIGGLGKTTLASMVYSSIQASFECRSWVSVSRTPNMKSILRGILRQVEDAQSSRGDFEYESERDLIIRIKGCLQQKRYLIVLDDVWSAETWEIIKAALPLNSFGSRVITTTRINNVAESSCSHWNDLIYNIKTLNAKDSRRLFHNRVFGSAGSCPPDLLDVSDKILKKCSGLPLAISTMSGLLANKPRMRLIWEGVYNSMSATPQSTEGMKNIFLLCYDDLPHHLKMCLLYLSIFPEDYVINRARIVRSWIAEEFISGDHMKDQEEVGEGYFNELINRHMIQPVHGSYDGRLEAYRIHGMMLDLMKSKSIEENVVTLFDSGEPLSMLHSKIRRLSLVNIKEDHCIPAPKTKSHIRSLSIFRSVAPKLSFKDFIFLRVLDMEGCMYLNDHNIKEIVDLIYLRYLSIRDTPITELPDQIGRLQWLTTLDVQGTEVRELPMSFVNLQRLAHLLCDKMRLPEWIGKMTALSYLSQFDIIQSKLLYVKGLGNLSELRMLVIWWFPDTETNNAERYDHLAFSLYRLNKLQSLCIYGNASPVVFLDHLRHPLQQLHRIQLNSRCYLIRIPAWFRSLEKLAYVCIDLKEVKNEDLQLFSELPCLLQLSLTSREIPTEKHVIGSKGFPVLQEFQLHNAREDLTFEPQAMQKLERLLLSLHAVPEETCGFSISIDQLMHLQKIDIRIYGNGAYASQLFETVDVAIRKAAKKHPNGPVVNIIALGNLKDYAAKKRKGNEPKLE
ncbi:unnamed protein product [Urochloa decumbens]|uniref:Uncharacterized protein n=1 Tax=Urochloa decumbens TaxID=240449 RepID=A0ABC9B1Z7_9POAL